MSHVRVLHCSSSPLFHPSTILLPNSSKHWQHNHPVPSLASKTQSTATTPFSTITPFSKKLHTAGTDIMCAATRAVISPRIAEDKMRNYIDSIIRLIP
jgi:hypothetical protein